MNTVKPDTLFQSMEKWIDLYRESNKCSEDQAHNAFEAWAEKLRDESADQTTKSFHDAVADEVVAMQSRQFHQQSKLEQCRLSAKHMGGPLIETGEDPLSFAVIRAEVEPAIPVTSASMVRNQAETDILFNTSFLASTKLPMDHASVVNAQVILAKAKRALELIVGVEERAKERKGKTLKLKGV
jgi:hypothetical protein